MKEQKSKMGGMNLLMWKAGNNAPGERQFPEKANLRKGGKNDTLGTQRYNYFLLIFFFFFF